MKSLSTRLLAGLTSLTGAFNIFGRTASQAANTINGTLPALTRALLPLRNRYKAAKEQQATLRRSRGERLRAKRQRTNLARTKNRSAKSQRRGQLMREYLGNRRSKATPSDMRYAVNYANYWLKQTV